MYVVVQGRKVGEDDPNNADKIPKTASDLRYPIYPLEMRQSRLDGLVSVKKSLRSLELSLIFLPVDDSKDTLEAVIKKIGILQAKIEMSGLKAPCESMVCASRNPKIFIYLSRCQSCCPQEKDHTLKSSLAVLRNVIQRITFLEEQVSSSLANLLTEPELKSVMSESSLIMSI